MLKMTDLFFTAVAAVLIFALLYLARLPGPHCKMEEKVEKKKGSLSDKKLIQWANAWMTIPEKGYLSIDADPGSLSVYDGTLYVFTEIAGWMKVMEAPPRHVLEEIVRGYKRE
mgnify:CR=1 FL=1